MGQQDRNRWILSSPQRRFALNGNTTTPIVHPTRNQKNQQPNVVLLLFARYCHISGDAGGDVAISNFTVLGVPWFGLGQAYLDQVLFNFTKSPYGRRPLL